MRDLRATWWWGAVLLGLAGLWLALAPLAGTDLWWQARIGADIIASGEIPTTTVYAATGADVQYVYASWGGAVVLAGLLEVGGLPLLALVRALVLLATYGALGWLILRRTGNGRIVAVGLFLAMVAGLSGWAPGTTMLALPLFLALVAIMGEVGREALGRRALFAVPLILLVLINLHELGWVSVLVPLAGALGAVIDRRRDHAEAPTYPTMRALVATAGASVVVLLINPRGLWLLLGILSEIGRAVFFDRSPLRALGEPTAQALVLVLLAGGAFIMLQWSRLRAGDLLLVGVLGLLALMGIGYAPFAGLALGLVAAEAVQRRGRLRFAKAKTERGPYVAVIGIVLLVATVVLQPMWRSHERPAAGPDLAVGLLDRSTPVAAVERIVGSADVWFHSLEDGSYLLWRAAGAPRVFRDPRDARHMGELAEGAECIAAGVSYDTFLDKYGINAVLADPALHGPLIEGLRADSAWTEEWSDGERVIFRRDPVTIDRTATYASSCELP